MQPHSPRVGFALVAWVLGALGCTGAVPAPGPGAGGARAEPGPGPGPTTTCDASNLLGPRLVRLAAAELREHVRAALPGVSEDALSAISLQAEHLAPVSERVISSASFGAYYAAAKAAAEQYCATANSSGRSAMCTAWSSAATPFRSCPTCCCAPSGEALRLKATDLDIEVTETVPPTSAAGGATTVPAHMIYDIVRKLPDGAQVSLETSGDAGRCTIRSGRSRFTLQALPESDFPDLAAGDLAHRFELAGGRPQAPDREDAVRDLDGGDALLPQRHLSCTPSRTGKDQPMLRAVATDGHRLARVEIAGAGRAPRACRASSCRARPWPRSASSSRTASEVTGSSCPQPRSASTFGDVVLTSKLIDGTFPDYQRVIPTGNDKLLTVDTRTFPGGGRPRLDDLVRARPRREARRSTDGRLTLSVNNPDSRQRHGGDRGRLRRRSARYRLQRPLPPRHHRPARRRHRPVQARRSRLADA